jgi:hypothetical protein
MYNTIVLNTIYSPKYNIDDSNENTINKNIIYSRAFLEVDKGLYETYNYLVIKKKEIDYYIFYDIITNFFPRDKNMTLYITEKMNLINDILNSLRLNINTSDKKSLHDIILINSVKKIELTTIRKLLLLKRGGTLIFKINSLCEEILNFIYYLSSMFNISIYKPKITNIFSTERFIICSNYRQVYTIQELEKHISLLKKYDKINYKKMPYFMIKRILYNKTLYECLISKVLVYTRCEAIHFMKEIAYDLCKNNDIV